MDGEVEKLDFKERKVTVSYRSSGGGSYYYRSAWKEKTFDLSSELITPRYTHMKRRVYAGPKPVSEHSLCSCHHTHPYPCTVYTVLCTLCCAVNITQCVSPVMFTYIYVYINIGLLFSSPLFSVGRRDASS